MNVQERLDQLEQGMEKMQEAAEKLEQERTQLQKAMLQQVGAITILKEVLKDEQPIDEPEVLAGE